MTHHIQKVDWDTVDYDKRLGEYVPLPNGEQFYLEMDMLCWYWVAFMAERGRTLASVIADALDVLQEDGEPYDSSDLMEVISTAILEYGREWVRVTEGRWQP